MASILGPRFRLVLCLVSELGEASAWTQPRRPVPWPKRSGMRLELVAGLPDSRAQPRRHHSWWRRQAARQRLVAVAAARDAGGRGRDPVPAPAVAAADQFGGHRW